MPLLNMCFFGLQSAVCSLFFCHLVACQSHHIGYHTGTCETGRVVSRVVWLSFQRNTKSVFQETVLVCGQDESLSVCYCQWLFSHAQVIYSMWLDWHRLLNQANPGQGGIFSAPCEIRWFITSSNMPRLTGGSDGNWRIKVTNGWFKSWIGSPTKYETGVWNWVKNFGEDVWYCQPLLTVIGKPWIIMTIYM